MFRYLAVGAVAAYVAYKCLRALGGRDDTSPTAPPADRYYGHSPTHPPHSHKKTSHPWTTPEPPVSHYDVRRNERTHTPAEDGTPASRRANARQEGDLTIFGGSCGDTPPSVPSLDRYHEHSPVRPPRSHEKTFPWTPTPEPPAYDERQHKQNHSDTTPAQDIHAFLRAGAKQDGDLVSRCYQQKEDAYEHRDHALAKASPKKGKRRQLRMKSLNAKASAILKENYQDKSPCNVDLHGLRVKEAIAYSDKAIGQARKRGEPEVRLIVGKGIHSDGGIARLKPAIQKNMLKRGFHVEEDPKNSGVLVVQLDDMRSDVQTLFASS